MKKHDAAPGTSIKVLDEYYRFASPLNLRSSLKRQARQTPGRLPTGQVRGRQHRPDVVMRETRVTKAASTRPPQRGAAPRWPLGRRETGEPLVNDDRAPFNRVWN